MDATASNESTGYGQQDPSDSNSDSDVWTFIAERIVARLEKMKLCKVTTVHGGGNSVAAAGTVEVQLLVSLLDGKGNATQQGVVYNVPWYRLQGGKNAVVIDPQVGDIGYLLCEDRDISNVKKAVADGNSPQTTPGSYRQNSISDSIYVGCALAKDAPEQYLWLKPDGGWKLTDSFGNVLESTSTGIQITPKAGTSVKVNGDLIATGNVTAGFGGADVVTLQLHIHPSNGAPPTPGH